LLPHHTLNRCICRHCIANANAIAIAIESMIAIAIAIAYWILDLPLLPIACCRAAIGDCRQGPPV
jgi:hypothetical protein